MVAVILTRSVLGTLKTKWYPENTAGFNLKINTLENTLNFPWTCLFMVANIVTVCLIIEHCSKA